ncbi:MAG TPA: hypothetical protein VFZ61_21410, partial [Polyangiales bacterium]
MSCLIVLAGCAEEPATEGNAPLAPRGDGGPVVSGDAGLPPADAGQWAIADGGYTVVDSGLVITPDGGMGCGSVKQASEALKP